MQKLLGLLHVKELRPNLRSDSRRRSFQGGDFTKFPIREGDFVL